MSTQNTTWPTTKRQKLESSIPCTENRTPKQRMLCAYRGMEQDRPPVAPEFWYLYPARHLGIDMVKYERDIPLWQALQAVFSDYGCEGWGIAFPEKTIEGATVRLETNHDCLGRLMEHKTISYDGRPYASRRMYDPDEASWMVEYPAKNAEDAIFLMEREAGGSAIRDFSRARQAHRRVGDAFLLELWLGTPFFDTVAEYLGFEKTIALFFDEDPSRLRDLQATLIEDRIACIREACSTTGFEAFCIGCAYSCNSLIGPALWRMWDKPYIAALSREIHLQGKLLHLHLHGKVHDTLADLVETGADCICPFERPPGGDIKGAEGLAEVRSSLEDAVTMNGNVHTVETLARGTEKDVHYEVSQIMAAFDGSSRYIVGTGDQVCRETPIENIRVMIETVTHSAGRTSWA